MKLRFLLILIMLTLFFGCAPSYAPQYWLPEKNELNKDVYGAYIYVVYYEEQSYDDRDKKNIFYSEIGDSDCRGEFIAVGNDSIVILQHNDSLMYIAKNTISYALIERVNNPTGSYSLWTVLGLISTVSHGFALSATAPVWTIVGIGTISGVSWKDIDSENYPQEFWWKEKSKYARFPKGLPINLSNVKTMKSKEYEKFR